MYTTRDQHDPEGEAAQSEVTHKPVTKARSFTSGASNTMKNFPLAEPVRSKTICGERTKDVEELANSASRTLVVEAVISEGEDELYDAEFTPSYDTLSSLEDSIESDGLVLMPAKPRSPKLSASAPEVSFMPPEKSNPWKNANTDKPERRPPHRSLSSLAKRGLQIPERQDELASPTRSPANSPSPTPSPARSMEELNVALTSSERLLDKSLGDELLEVLKDPKKSVVFKRFLKKEYCSEALLFWVEAETYTTSFRPSWQAPIDQAEMKKESQRIYTTYMSDTAESQINIDMEIQKAIESNLNSPTYMLFRDAQSKIFELLKTDSFRKFRKSTLYKKTIDKVAMQGLLSQIQEEESRERRSSFTSKSVDKELNTRQPFNGEPHPDPCYLSAFLVNEILALFKKHTHKMTSIFGDFDEDRSAVEVIQADAEYKRFLLSVLQLQKVKLEPLTHKERLVFFVNIYNTLSLHALVELETPSSTSQKHEFWKKAKYKIGGEVYSLLEIEHAVLRAALPRVSSLGVGLIRTKLPRFTKQDPRAQFALTLPEPIVNFVLYSCSQSSPPITVFSPVNFKPKMTQLAQEFLSKEVELIGCDSYDTKQIMKLPKIISWFQKDFGSTDKDLVENLLPYLPESMRAKVRFFLASIKLRYKDYKWNIGGYMGSAKYDPHEINEEMKRELQSAINEQIVEFTKLKNEAASKEEYFTAHKYKEKIDELKQKLLTFS